MRRMGNASRAPRASFACGLAGAVLFVVVFLVAGALRPGYSALRHPVSSLALGESGRVQSTSFVATGVLMFAFAVGVRRTAGGLWLSRLLGVYAIGLAGAGFFRTDPISGYPAGTPALGQSTLTGSLHDTFSALVFAALPLACGVLARRCFKSGRTGWAWYSVATAVVFLAGFVLAGVGFAQNAALLPVAGLLQRLTLVVGWVWVGALAAHLLRRSAPA
ncbi:DUF998 domain-containing protein [Saccharopolyspora spinosporotrichia]